MKHIDGFHLPEAYKELHILSGKSRGEEKDQTAGKANISRASYLLKKPLSGKQDHFLPLPLETDTDTHKQVCYYLQDAMTSHFQCARCPHVHSHIWNSHLPIYSVAK